MLNFAVLSFQLVRIATPEFGVSKMLICLEPSLLPTRHPKMPFLVWCFLQDLGVAEEFLVYSWLSNRISTTSPITDIIFSSDMVYKAANQYVTSESLHQSPSCWVIMCCCCICSAHLIVNLLQQFSKSCCIHLRPLVNKSWTLINCRQDSASLKPSCKPAKLVILLC